MFRAVHCSVFPRLLTATTYLYCGNVIHYNTDTNSGIQEGDKGAGRTCREVDYTRGLGKGDGRAGQGGGRLKEGREQQLKNLRF